MRLLVVEDDPMLRDGLKDLLTQRGWVVDAVGYADQALNALKQEAFDLMVLDIGLPGMDGFELLRRVRASGNNLGVLVLTARDALSERVHGLEVGADDYLTKPFAPEELVARLTALGRRARAIATQALTHGPLTLDRTAHRASLSGQALELPAREWSMLEFLVENADRVVSKDKIVAAVCSWEEDMSSNAVEVYISRLRSKLEPAGLRIRTVRGYGYMLEPFREPA